MNESEYIPPDCFFKRLKVDVRRLAPFGFARKGACWEYSENVAGGALVCHIAIDSRGGVSECVTDIATGDEYAQHRGMDGPRFLPAYHMNKKTWTTIVLDGTVRAEELQKLLAESRKLATK